MLAPAGFKEEARKFLEATSVRGVPRILKSRSQYHSFFWLLGVLICTGLLIWQATNILLKYFSYPINTLYVQAKPSEYPTFPDITFCNNRPLRSSKQLPLSYSDYVNKVSNSDLTSESFIQTFTTTHNITDEDYWTYFDNVMTTAVYLRSFPIVDSQKLNENITLAINCSYFDWDLSFTEYECLNELVPLWSSDYHTCYTTRLPNVDLRKNVRGFSAIFYIDNYLEIRAVPFQMSLEDVYSAGVRVLVHPAGTIPELSLGFVSAPGMSTTVHLQQSIVSHLPSPYSQCTTQTTLLNADGTPVSNSTYTQNLCVNICYQQEVVKKCECLSDFFSFTEDQLISTNYTMCGNLSLTNQDSVLSMKGFEDLVCEDKAYWDGINDYCFGICPMQCIDYQYGSSTSASLWPDTASQISFYDTYIRDKVRFGSKFDEYKNVSKAANNDVTSDWVKEQTMALDAEGLIRNNFLQLNIMFDLPTYYQQKDVPAYPAETLGAQIGGVLSLWLGVTVMFVLEVSEFVFTVCLSCYRRHKMATSTPVVPFKETP